MTAQMRSALTVPLLILGVPWNLAIVALIGVTSVLHGAVYIMASIQNAVAIWLTKP